MIWHRKFHRTVGVVHEHFLHINGLAEIYWVLLGQLGHYSLKKFFVSMYMVWMMRYPEMSRYSFSFIDSSTTSETVDNLDGSRSYLFFVIVPVDYCLRVDC